MKKIPLNKSGLFALVDDEDYVWASRVRWGCYDGYAKRSGARVNGKRQTEALHRLILGAKIGLNCDHVNQDNLDNRRCNLRLVTKAQNNSNVFKRSTGRNPYKGVYPHWLKWRAGIRHNGKRFYLGLFNTPEEAALAYNKEASKLFGKFACLNEIPKVSS